MGIYVQAPFYITSIARVMRILLSWILSLAAIATAGYYYVELQRTKVQLENARSVYSQTLEQRVLEYLDEHWYLIGRSAPDEWRDSLYQATEMIKELSKIGELTKDDEDYLKTFINDNPDFDLYQFRGPHTAENLAIAKRNLLEGDPIETAERLFTLLKTNTINGCYFGAYHDIKMVVDPSPVLKRGDTTTVQVMSRLENKYAIYWQPILTENMHRVNAYTTQVEVYVPDDYPNQSYKLSIGYRSCRDSTRTRGLSFEIPIESR